MGAQETAQAFLLLSSNNKRALTSINEVYKLEYSISIMLIIVNVYLVFDANFLKLLLLNEFILEQEEKI